MTSEELTQFWGYSLYFFKTHYAPKLPSYRNQSADLQQFTGFYYDGNFGV